MLGFLNRGRHRRPPDLRRLPPPPMPKRTIQRVERDIQEVEDEEDVRKLPDHVEVLVGDSVPIARITRLVGHMVMPLTYFRMQQAACGLRGLEGDADLMELFENDLCELLLSVRGESRKELVDVLMGNAADVAFEEDSFGKPMR